MSLIHGMEIIAILSLYTGSPGPPSSLSCKIRARARIGTNVTSLCDLLNLQTSKTLDPGSELGAPAGTEACKREFKRNIICIFVSV